MDRFLIHPDTFGEAAGHLPVDAGYQSRLDTYLGQIERLKTRLSIPVVASLNGSSLSGWVELGREMEAAGADALELNAWYMASDPGLAGAALEERYLALLRELKAVVKIPVTMKLSPFFSALPQLRRPGRGRRRRGRVAVQPLLPARHRPRHLVGGRSRAVVLARRRPPHHALDRAAARPHRAEPGSDRRRAWRGRRAEDAARRRRRGAHGERAAEERPAGDHRRARRHDALDERARVRIGRPAQGFDEPAPAGRPERLRARGLSQRNRFLLAAAGGALLEDGVNQAPRRARRPHRPRHRRRHRHPPLGRARARVNAPGRLPLRH